MYYYYIIYIILNIFKILVLLIKKIYQVFCNEKHELKIESGFLFFFPQTQMQIQSLRRQKEIHCLIQTQKTLVIILIKEKIFNFNSKLFFYKNLHVCTLLV